MSFSFNLKKLGAVAMSSLTLACVLCAAVPPAYATDAADACGNRFESDESTAHTENVDGDYYWAGQYLSLDNATVGRDVIAVGQNVDIADAMVNGALRVAAQTLDVKRTTVTGTTTIAGQAVTVNRGVQAEAVYAGGVDVSYLGSSKALTIAGRNVTINGTVDGNVTVYAESLSIGKNANIKGTLNATVTSDPSISKNAQIGTVNISVDQEAQGNTTSSVLELAGALISAAVFGAITAAIVFKILPRAVLGSAGMVHEHPAGVFATGLIVLVFSVPLALILLLSVGLSNIGGTIAAAFVGALFISMPLTAAATALLAFPRLKLGTACLLGGAIFGAASQVPYLGEFISLASIVFTLGYTVKAIKKNIREVRLNQAGANSKNLPA